jgi:hypothetical protein
MPALGRLIQCLLPFDPEMALNTTRVTTLGRLQGRDPSITDLKINPNPLAPGMIRAQVFRNGRWEGVATMASHFDSGALEVRQMQVWEETLWRCGVGRFLLEAALVEHPDTSVVYGQLHDVNLRLFAGALTETRTLDAMNSFFRLQLTESNRERILAAFRSTHFGTVSEDAGFSEIETIEIHLFNDGTTITARVRRPDGSARPPLITIGREDRNQSDD